ncbi:MAG: hypothetical protein AAFQ22_05325 [Pseudomonadota bacterium]
MAVKAKSVETLEGESLREPFDQFEADHMPRASLSLPEKVESPVHEMQAGLVAEFTLDRPALSRREVYGSVIVFCFAVWWALYMFATTLI